MAPSPISLFSSLMMSDGRFYLEESEGPHTFISYSGLKTILVLSFLYLVPHIENKPLDEYLFGFEELRITYTSPTAEALTIPQEDSPRRRL